MNPAKMTALLNVVRQYLLVQLFYDHTDGIFGLHNIEKIEVIMDAFAGIIAEEVISCVLVMPQSITSANFHGGKDVDKTGM